MELMIAGSMREPEKFKHSQVMETLKDEDPLLIFGKSGEGKTAGIIQFAKDVGKQLLTISLAMEMPETMGGIPYVKPTEDTKDKKMTAEYFVRLMDERLKPVIEVGGKDWIVFFDEINQASPEVFNTMYSICHGDPEQRNWNGHPLPHLQVVAAGNMDDGSDGTTYLNALPTPLLNRFDICQLVSDRKETLEHLKDKWKNIPQVSQYINTLLDNNIPPRDIDHCLKIIAFNKSSARLQMKLGSALTAKLYEIQKKAKPKDPAEVLKGCRTAYNVFKEYGRATWGPELIETEEELIEKFKEILTEEEIQSILKGDE